VALDLEIRPKSTPGWRVRSHGWLELLRPQGGGRTAETDGECQGCDHDRELHERLKGKPRNPLYRAQDPEPGHLTGELIRDPRPASEKKRAEGKCAPAQDVALFPGDPPQGAQYADAYAGLHNWLKEDRGKDVQQI